MKAYTTQILLLASLISLAGPSAQAQLYTATANSTFLNVYYNDGTGTVPLTVSPYSPIETVKSFGSTGIGMPLTSYGPFSWLQLGPTYPGLVSANTTLALPTTANASASVQYLQGSLYMGSNIVENSSTYVSPQGTVLYLNNSTSAGIAELRLDWTTTYKYNGPPQWSAGTYIVGQAISDQNGNAEICIVPGTTGATEPPATTWPGSPTSGGTTQDGPVVGGVKWMIVPTYVPAGLTLDIAGNVASSSDFIAVTGQEEFTVNSTTSTMVQIPWGGDFSSALSVPWAPGFLDNGLLGIFPGVFGSDTPGPVFTTIGAPGGLPLPIKNNDLLTVSGYLDLFVDPATAQVGIKPVAPDTLGITNTAKGPVVYFPMVTPGNHTLQTCTNLLSGNWTPVTNGTPTTVTNESGAIYSGLLFTNKAKAAFFRLH